MRLVNTASSGRLHFKKHPSFSIEREYRLLVDNMLLGCDNFDFRPTRSTLVPYVPVLIPRDHSRYSGSSMKRSLNPLAGRWDFIDRVVIGPTANMDLSVAAVASFFRKQSMAVEVVSSNIPCRDC